MRDAIRAVGLLAAIAVAPGCDRAVDWQAQVDGWQYPEPVPDFALTDQRGKRFRLHRYADDWLLLGFVYSRCPRAEACPMTVAKMRAARDGWDSTAGTLSLLCVTLDPAYDTPERLAKFADAHGADWTFATGPQGLMTDGLPSLFGVLALPDPHGELSHTIKIALLAPGLRMHAEWTDNAITPELVRAEALTAP